MVIRYGAQRNLLVVSKGHPFDRGAFYQMMDAVLADVSIGDEGIAWTHVEHPAAPACLAPEYVSAFDAILFYDLPGIWFRVPDAPALVAPPLQLPTHFAALTEKGTPLFFLHHALAGWPAWPEYGDIVGGRFHYLTDPQSGRPCDGYRHDVEHFVRVVADHPVTEGLGEGFSIKDELYLVNIDEADKLPLLRSDYSFVSENFYSAELAIRGEMFCRDGWEHPPGSDLIAWAKRAGDSPVVYLQCGDGPTAFANDGFRRVLGNTIQWLLSPAAADWARSFRG
jgi:hypothetical protein